MSEPENGEQANLPKTNSPRGIGERIKAFGAYSILLTVLGIGITISTIFWSSSNTNLQNDLRRAQESLSEARAELSQLKSEYAQYRAQAQNKAEDSQGKAVPSANISSPQIPPLSTLQDQVEVSVDEGKTASLFEGDLLISLIQTSFDGQPLAQKVFATIGSPNQSNVRIEGEDVGYKVTYNGKAKYEIRITAADTFSAKFLAKQIS